MSNEPSLKAGFICETDPYFGCPFGYFFAMENCYKAFPDQAMKAAEAEIFCRDESGGGGGTLATPTTNIHTQFLNLLIRDTEVDYLENRDLNISHVEYWLGFNFEEDADRTDIFANPAEVDKDCVKFGKKDGTDEEMERVSCADSYFPLCQRPLRLAPSQVSRVTNPVHALPLGVADAHKDITRVQDRTSQVNVGYSSLAAPSSIIGYARFGGGEPVSFPAGQPPRDGSYVDILTDPKLQEPHTFDSLGVTMWIRPKNLDQTQTLLDCNNHGKVKDFLKLDLLTTGRLSAYVVDGSGVQHDFESLEKFPVEAGEWSYVGFTFDGESGTFFVGEQFGYHNATNGRDRFWSYFTLSDPGIWPQDAFSDTCRVGARKNLENEEYHGDVSCVQIFRSPGNAAKLKPAQALHFSDCPLATSEEQRTNNSCPAGYDFYHEMCYKVAEEKGTFAEAQMSCMPSGEVRSGMYDERMMFSEKRHVLTHVLQKVEAKHGESRYWLGLDLRNKGWDGDDNWENSAGVRNISKTHENWNGTEPSVQHSCAVVSGGAPADVGHAGFMESSACLVNIPYVCERAPLTKEPDNKCPKVK